MRWYCTFPHPVISYNVPGGWIDVTLHEGGTLVIDDWGVVINGACEKPTWCTEAMRIRIVKRIQL